MTSLTAPVPVPVFFPKTLRARPWYATLSLLPARFVAL